MGNPRKSTYADYEAFMLRHRTTVWRACCRFARNNKELARDLVQEVYLAMWIRYDQLGDRANAWQQRAWVWRTARSVLVDLYRKREPDTVPLDSLDEEHLADTTVDYARHINDMMGLLGDEERRLLQMRLDGYDAAEIAQALGIERNNVYQRMNRIINKLKKEYGR